MYMSIKVTKYECTKINMAWQSLIPDYSKRNAHFHRFMETKLLLIERKYLRGFLVYVFQFIWLSYTCTMYELFGTQQI
jgi:hypothetical protein